MLLLGDQGPHCYLSSTTFFSLVRIPYVMRTTIHNRRGTNHLIDPRFRSERLQLQSDNVNTFEEFLSKLLQYFPDYIQDTPEFSKTSQNFTEFLISHQISAVDKESIAFGTLFSFRTAATTK